MENSFKPGDRVLFDLEDSFGKKLATGSGVVTRATADMTLVHPDAVIAPGMKMTNIRLLKQGAQ